MLCESEITQCCTSGASALPSFGVVMLRRSQEAEQRASEFEFLRFHEVSMRFSMRFHEVQCCLSFDPE